MAGGHTAQTGAPPPEVPDGEDRPQPGWHEGRGAGVDSYKEYGRVTPLMAASANAHEGVVRLLLSRGADASLRNDDGTTALSLAATDEIEELLRAHGAVDDEEDEDEEEDRDDEDDQDGGDVGDAKDEGGVEDA